MPYELTDADVSILRSMREALANRGSDSGSSSSGIAQMIHRRGTDTRPTRLKIFGNRTLGACYKAYIWKPPTTSNISFDLNAVLTSASYGVQGEEVIAINQVEVAQATVTHDLTAGTPKVLFVWGFPSALSSSTDTKRVFDIWMLDWLACT